MHPFTSPAALIFILLLLAGNTATAADAPPAAAQQRCIAALQKAGAGVASAAARAALHCVKASVRGKLAADGIGACLAARNPDIERARDATLAAAARECGETPAFGPANPEDVNAAFSEASEMTALFGAELADVLDSGGGDRATARCQLTLAQSFATFVRTELAEYHRCVRKRLKGNQASTAADLEACIGADSPRLRDAERKAESRIARRCDGIAGRTAFPGLCASLPGGEPGACLVAQAHCSACTAVNRADRLSADCRKRGNYFAAPYCDSRPQRHWSVARQWNEEILDAIRLDNPRPGVHARNLFHLSLAMYDAWTAYGGGSKPYLTAEHPASADIEHDRRIAISYAAYRVLSRRYSEKLALGSAASQARFGSRMARLGLDPGLTDTTGNTPASVGNRIAAAVLAFGDRDGAGEAANYQDPTYTPVNKPLIVKLPGIDLTDPSDPGYHLDPNRWQPLALDKTVSQNGIPLPGKVQTFIGSQWGGVIPFALPDIATAEALYDPGPPPRLGGEGDAEYKAQALRVIELASQLAADDGATMDVSPASLGNNPLGSNEGAGHPVNPATGQPYPPQVVPRGDFGRVVAEFWADGPHSETPPGHWNTIANAVADSPGFQRRIGGGGPELAPLEWDVKTYFALNGALHDAAIACWGSKRKYDGVRPITMIRYMARNGQSSDPSLPSYSPRGLPLKPGLVELVTPETAAPGGRHAELVSAEAGGRIGDVALLSWPGSPADPQTRVSGVRWGLGTAWLPYQRRTFVTPAFPGYISGHSTFSRAAAEVLAALTGSPYFPGGLMEFAARKDDYLIHERGPSVDLRLQWASYFDAADQAGQSRLWGGIHVEADDFAGRRIGQQVGRGALARAMEYFGGAADR